jgi:hypothetical protein
MRAQSSPAPKNKSFERWLPLTHVAQAILPVLLHLKLVLNLILNS